MLFEQIVPEYFYHWIDRSENRIFFGCGFIDKSHWTVDQVNIATEQYSLVLILRGRAWYTDASGKKHELKTGDYFQRIPGIRHTTMIDPDSSYMEGFVVIGKKFYDAWAELGVLPAGQSPCGHCANLNRAAGKICHLQSRMKSISRADLPDRMMECQDIILQVIRDQPENPDMSELMERACVILTSDFSRPFDFRKFCQENGIGYHTFRRHFKKYAGLSPQQFRQTARLDQAANLLKSQKYNVSETAELLHFSSAYEFSTRFRKCFGVPPSQWRKQ